MQKDLDAYLITYDTKQPHQGRGMNGQPPLTSCFTVCRNSKPKEDKMKNAFREQRLSGEYPICTQIGSTGFEGPQDPVVASPRTKYILYRPNNRITANDCSTSPTKKFNG